MRSSSQTLLSLFEWGQIMGISPWELAGISLVNAGIRDAVACAHLFCQYSYQQNFLSREEVGEAISRAESMIAEQALFWPAPKYLYNEFHNYPRPHENYLYGGGGTQRWQMKAVQVDYCKVQSGGILARTLIGTAQLTYQDTNNDNIDDAFTCTIATTITDVSEIGVYYLPADRLGNDVDETWRLRPVTVTISGGQATIRGHVALCGQPYLWDGPGAQVIDATDINQFITGVEVYRVYTDTSSSTANPAQGTAVWQPFQGDPSAPLGQSQSLPLVIMPNDSEQGLVAVDYLLQNTQQTPYPREPDRVYLNYLAGYPLVNGRMAPDMAKAVAYLATAILPVGKCGCDRSNQIISWWRNLPSDGDPGRNLTQAEIDNNPFGPERGAAYSWQRVRQFKKIIGYTA